MGLGHSPSIVVDGLVFYIDPNNTNCYSGSGNTVYSLVNPSIGGTFVGYTSNPIDNTENRSIYFDGSNDFILYGDTTSFSVTLTTICVWFKKSHGSSFMTLVDKGRDNYGAWSVCVDETANKVTFKARISGTNRSITCSSNYNSNSWNYVCGVYDGINLSIYLNGSLNNSASHLGTIDNNSVAIRLGSANDGYNLLGSIGHVSIYNKALTPTEILQNYNATKKKYDPDENIVINGLVLNIDPSKSASYPGTGNTIYDLSGSGNTGTLVSSPTFSSFNSGSLVFNGNSYITRSSALNTGQNFSVTAWIYPTSLSGGGRNAIIGNGYPFLTDNGWFFCISNNNFGTFQSLMISLGQDNCIKISNSYVFQLYKWTHVAVTVSGGGSVIKLYANGIETSYGFSGGSARTLSYSTNEFHVGMRHSGTPERFAGNISGVQIYNKVLSAQEILQNYNATKNRFVNALSPVRNGLVLELDAGQRASYPGTGNTWYDLSGNSLNGTLFNAPTFTGIGASSSILLNASNQVVALALNSKLDISESITIESFIYPTAYNTSGDFGSFIICKAASYYLELNGNGKVRVYFYSLSSEGYHESVGTVPLNTWSYISVVRNKAASTISIYINGILDRTLSSITGDIRVQQTYPVNLGSFQGSGYTFTGRIAVGTIYNRALSAYEIKQNFDFYRTRYNI
jgi:hypothetical protein